MIAFRPASMGTKTRLVFAILAIQILGTPLLAVAGNWRVSPIKIFFDAKTRSEVITVSNDGDQPLKVEITAMEWSQDGDGRDLYQPATDLIFFPKQLVIEPNQERVIRAGIKVPAIERERSYRLFIREVPDQRQPDANTIAIAIQFGVPIFVAPPKAEIKGEIVSIAMQKGQVTLLVKNQGNSHFRVNRVKLQGKTSDGTSLDATEAPGWYLLAGLQRAFKAEIPMELCRKADFLDIIVEADRITLSGSTHVDKAQCSTP